MSLFDRFSRGDRARPPRTDTARRARISSAQIIPLSFLGAILLGTVLLYLPVSTAPGAETDLLTALFTSTTSVCVTGLVVVDTFSHWSFFGQSVILVLIQVGGLGIVSVMAALTLTLRRKISLRNTLIIHDAFNLTSMHDLVSFLLRVVRWTFAVEAVGALLYLPGFIRRFGPAQGIWNAVFTAVSAFCNAGLDTLGASSLVPWQTSVPVLGVTMLLIVLGGLGYIVWFDVAAAVRTAREKRFGPITTLRRMSEHTKLVLVSTLALIVGGALLFLLMEYDNPATIGTMRFGEKLLNSVFQSVTYRTAGFSSVPQEGMTPGSSLIGCVLMFIGGSPVGTAGGVKTVVFIVVVMNVLSFVRDREDTVIFRRAVPEKLIRKANAIVTVMLFAIVVILILLVTLSGCSVLDGLYEACSALCTVGLSRSLTASLNTPGRIIIILAMYMGRIGPISMALFFSTRAGGHVTGTTEGVFIVG